MSTGIGPVGYYTSIGDTRRPQAQRAASPRTSSRAAGPSPAALAKIHEAERLQAALDRITGLATHNFVDASPPAAPRTPAIDEVALVRAHEALAVAGIRPWKRSARKLARVQSQSAARAEAARLRSEYAALQRSWQEELDLTWRALGDNDPEVVLATLAAAFEDNAAPAAAIGVHDDEVSLVVLIPSLDQAVPERRPTTTVAGNLSLKKLSKSDRSELYAWVVAGHVLSTVKECFAVARGVGTARVVAVRPDTGRAHGGVEAVLAAVVQRGQLQGVGWDSSDAWTILRECSSDLHVHQKGAAKEMQPLDVDAYPGLGSVLAAITVDEPLGSTDQGVTS